MYSNSILVLVLAMLLIQSSSWILANAQDDDESGTPDLPNATYHARLSELQKSLLSNYSPNVMPGKSVEIHVPQGDHITSFTKDRLAMLDHVEEVRWNDPRLSWDGTEKSADAVYLSSWKLWIPKFYLLNSAAGSNYKYRIHWWSRTRIDPNGDVTIKPRFNLKATCIFDYTNFPFDEQLCPFAIGNWDYDAKGFIY